MAASLKIFAMLRKMKDQTGVGGPKAGIFLTGFETPTVDNVLHFGQIIKGRFTLGLNRSGRLFRQRTACRSSPDPAQLYTASHCQNLLTIMGSEGIWPLSGEIPTGQKPLHATVFVQLKTGWIHARYHYSQWGLVLRTYQAI